MSAASWCACMAWGTGSPRVVVKTLAPRGRAACRGPRLSQSRTPRQRLLARGEAPRARRRLVVLVGDSSEGVPLVGNWSEMFSTVREQDVLPVRVLIRVLSPPCPESWPSHCQSRPSHCQRCWKTLSSRRLFRCQRGP
jgi:hypothetical protein